MSNRPARMPFELNDYFREDPFKVIYIQRRQDTDFFNIYIDYSQYFQSLDIAWQRIKKGCKDVGGNQVSLSMIQANERSKDETLSLIAKKWGLMNTLQYDVESFINIARTTMDKLAKLIEKLLGLTLGKGRRISFTDHKKDLPVDYPDVHPVYLDLLQNRTYWYDQELLLLRDKIFAHGNTFTTAGGQSSLDGVSIKKMGYLGGLRKPHKKMLLEIKSKYEDRHPSLRITNNDYEMLDDFLRQTRRQNIRLDEVDVNKLRSIVSSYGITIDEEFLESIAQHLEDYMYQVAIIFEASI